MNDKTKSTRRLMIPGSAYDVDGMEFWLSKQADLGWFLKRDGCGLWLAYFEKGEAANIKYRLEPAPKAIDALSENREPSQDAQELASHYGWEYIATRGQFYIYKNSNVSARELNTDPLVQAYALNRLRRREIASVLVLCFAFFIYPLLAMRGDLFNFLLVTPSAPQLAALTLLLGIYSILSPLYRLSLLSKLRKRLLSGEAAKTKDRRFSFCRAGIVLNMLIFSAWFISFVCVLLNFYSDEAVVSLKDYTQPLPFATICDYADGDYSALELGLDNDIREFSSPLADRVIYYAEIAEVTSSENARISGNLYVDYFECQSSLLARGLVRDDERNHKREAYTAVDFVYPKVEYASAWLSELNTWVLLLRDGERVMLARFSQHAEGSTLTFESWAKLMAESFVEQ